MNDAEVRSYEAFLRMREFAAAESARLAGNTFAGELFARLDTVLKGIDAQAAAQSSGKGASKQGTSGARAQSDAVLAQLKAVRRTARAMDQTMPGLADKFRVPAGLKRQEVLSLARAFAADAAPLKGEFVKRGLPANFLDALEAAADALEKSINEKMQSEGARVKATAAVGSLIEQGQEIKVELDALMRNVFAGDAATLAAWASASHIEHAPRKRKKVEAAPAA
ncbi:MAG: hypothetical protein QOG00_2411 [Pyrinomonadaceae bacterium]|nr:hypothetical protein [Pyrinomonadaceae bacterium]